MMPSETGIQFAAIPIGFRADRVRVAFADPCDDQAHEAVTAYFLQFDSVVSELSDIEQAWRTMEQREPHVLTSLVAVTDSAVALAQPQIGVP